MSNAQSVDVSPGTLQVIPGTQVLTGSGTWTAPSAGGFVDEGDRLHLDFTGLSGNSILTINGYNVYLEPGTSDRATFVMRGTEWEIETQGGLFYITDATTNLVQGADYITAALTASLTVTAAADWRGSILVSSAHDAVTYPVTVQDSTPSTLFVADTKNSVYETKGGTFTSKQVEGGVPVPLPGEILLLDETNLNARGFPTIAEALAAADSGEMVMLGLGTYSENVTLPAGVTLQAAPISKKQVRLLGADTTSTRVTMGAGSRLRGIAVEGPSSGASPAIITSSTGESCIEYLEVEGTGGTGPLIRADGDGTATCHIDECNFIGTASKVLEMNTTGELYVRNVKLRGTSTVVTIDASSAASFALFEHMRTEATHSSPIGMRISAAGEYELVGCSIKDGCTVAGQFATGSDGCRLTVMGGIFEGVTYDVEAVAGLTGVGTRWYGSGFSYRQERANIQAGQTWVDNLILSAVVLDRGVWDDTGVTIDGQIAIGRPGAGAELCAGEGDSTVYNMYVLSATGASSNTTDGTGFVDNTAAARSVSGSTFDLWQGTAIHNVAYFTALGRTFPNIKVDMNTAIALGSGEICWEYWNGTQWAYFPIVSHATTPRGIFVADSNWPYGAYANVAFGTSTSQQLRWREPSDWATKSINGVTSYWVRCRIGDQNYGGSAITTVPSIERIKIGTNRLEINKDGVEEFFGKAIKPFTFWRSNPEGLSAAAGGTNAPDNSTINFSTHVSYRNIGGTWNVGERAGTMIEIPIGLDTSQPLTFTLTWLYNTTDTGTLEWNLYVVKVSEGTVIGALTEQAITQTFTPPGVDEYVAKTTFEIEANDLVPGEFIAFMLFRGNDGGDTYGNNPRGLTMSWSGYRWR